MTRRLQTAAIIGCAVIVAFGAIQASFIFITDFALATGWPPDRAWLMPLCLDALGACGLLIYGTTRDRFAGLVATGAIAASMLANAASHWFTTGKLEPSWLSITSSAIVPALSIGLIVHMIVRWMAGRDERRPQLVDDSDRTRRSTAADGGDAGTGGSGRTASRPQGSQPARRPPPRKRDGKRGPTGPAIPELIDIIRRDGLTTHKQVIALGVGDRKATKALALAANGHAPEQP